MSEEREVIHAMYTQNTFVKIKQSLEIGKILFSFVDTQNKQNIDCYMSAEEFGALLMQDVKNGSIFKRLAAEKAKGEQYPKEIWTSPIGGSNKNGNPVSRHFTIAPGAKAEVVLTATQSLATQSDKGAFIPVKGSKATVIRVGCTYNDLRLLQYKWSYLEKEYMESKYNMEAMKSSYVPNTAANNQQAQTDDRRFTVNFHVIEKLNPASNGMHVYNISTDNKAGKLYVRPEDLGCMETAGPGSDIKLLCEKKGDNYLLVR